MAGMQRVRLLMSEFVTHDVKRFIVERPPGLAWQPGQGVELASDEDGWRDQGRPFTPTSLADDGVLEFTVKAYRDHDGVTRRLHALGAGAPLLISEPFGAIAYRGRGTFIAGGAGITPFLAILRALARRDALDGHRLIYANKTAADIICEKELRHYFGQHALFTCSRSSTAGCAGRRVDETFLREHIGSFDQNFYVCGPDAFNDAVLAALRHNGAKAEALVFET
jgi:cytochrome-b5 reductase